MNGGGIVRKSLKTMLSLTVIAGLTLASFTGCSFKKDAISTYNKAVTKTKTIKTAEEIVSIDMSVTAGEKTETAKIVADMMNNYTDKKASGKMKLISAGEESEVDMYTVGDNAYVKVPGQEQYLKSSAKQSQLSNETAIQYAEKILKVFQENADLAKTVTAEKNKQDNSKTITFTVPADKTKELLRGIVKETVTNEDVKKAAIGQATAQMKKQYKDKEISEEQIKKIVEEQMAEIDKSIDKSFKEISFDTMKYTVIVNKNGFITKQLFNFGMTTKTGEKTTLVLTYELKSINNEIKVTTPKFTKENTKESASFNETFMSMFR